MSITSYALEFDECERVKRLRSLGGGALRKRARTVIFTEEPLPGATPEAMMDPVRRFLADGRTLSSTGDHGQ